MPKNNKLKLISGSLSMFILFICILLLPNQTHASVISKSPANTLTSGLVGWWTMDGANMKNNVTDSSGRGNNGYMSDFTSTSTAVVAGKIGQALKFNGTSSYVRLATSSISDFTSANSVCMWMNTKDKTFVGAGSVSQTALNLSLNVSYGNSATSNAVRFGQDETSPGGKIFVSYLSGSTNKGQESTSAVLSNNTWNHVCYAFNGSTMTLYANGRSAASSAISWSIGAENLIGGKISTLGFWKGSIDDIRVYNRTLSATEVKQLYNQGAGTKMAVSPKLTLTSGLVGYWTMDGKDMLNGTIKDMSGHSNTGTPINIATSTFYTQGKIGQAILIASSSSANSTSLLPRVNMANTATSPLNLTGNMVTISAWVNPSLIQLWPSQQFFTVFYKGGYTSGYRLMLSRSSATASKAWLQVAGTQGGNTPQTAISAATFPANKWTHIVGIYNGTTQMIYINTVKDANTYATTTNIADSGSVVPQLGTSSTLNGGSSYWYNGKIDDVRVYNRALSATEIKQLYNIGAATKMAVSPKPTLASGLVGYWTMDGKNLKNNVTDSSGKNNNGYMSGFTSTSTALVAGKLGQGLRFASSTSVTNSSYLQINQSSSINNLGPVTYAAWIKPTSVGRGILGGASIFDKRYRVVHLSNVLSPSKSIVIRMLISTNTTNAQPYCSNIGINANAWTHIAVAWDGQIPFTGSMYVNGSSCTIAGATGAGIVNDDSSTNQFVGARYNSTSFFDGSIDDVRIYNRVLSATEIKQIYNLGK